MYHIYKNKIISNKNISGIIIKGTIDTINKEKRVFSGFGSAQVIDRQGDYLPIEEFKPVMEKLMQRGAPVTDSHSNHVVGKIVDYTYKPTPSGELGLYLTAEIYSHYPTDDETWQKILDGEYTGFSLGGKAGTKTPTCTNVGCYNILGNIEAWEFSIVERPANQLANIDKVNKLAKSSDVVDEVISLIIQKERVYIKTPADAPEGVKVQEGKRHGIYYESEPLVNTQGQIKPQIIQKIPKTKIELEKYSKQLDGEWKKEINGKHHSNLIFMMADWIGDEAVSNLAIRDLAADYYGYKNDLNAYVQKFKSHGFSFSMPKELLAVMVESMFQGIDRKTGQMMTPEQVKEIKLEKLNSLLAQKQFTQKKTEEMFGSNIEVYRGINKEELTRLKSKGYKYQEMALSSYTMNKDIAKAFVGNGGAIIKRKVNAKDIWFAWYSNPSMTYYPNPQIKSPELEIVVGNPQAFHKVEQTDIEEII